MFDLVSVCIISFNSSNTIVETLNSIKEQTYPNIELIISDDCSSDNTVSIVEQWIKFNKDSNLKKIELVKHEINGGTCKNLNDCIKNSSGKWIKILAADDMLVSDAIEKYVCFCEKENCHFAISDCNIICNEPNVKTKLEQTYKIFFSTVNYPLRKKQKKILYEYTYPGPCYFFSREMYDDIQGFSEIYDLAEEWPFVFHSLRKGYDIKALDSKLVDYRFQNTSLSHSPAIGSRLLEGNILFYKQERKPALLKKGLFFRVWHQNYMYFIIKKYNGKRMGIILKYLSPLSVIDKIKWFIYAACI